MRPVVQVCDNATPLDDYIDCPYHGKRFIYFGQVLSVKGTTGEDGYYCWQCIVQAFIQVLGVEPLPKQEGENAKLKRAEYARNSQPQ